MTSARVEESSHLWTSNVIEPVCGDCFKPCPSSSAHRQCRSWPPGRV